MSSSTMTPEHLAILHAALDAAYAADVAKNAAIAARKADNAACEARIAKCCALDEEGFVNGIIFTTYAGEELVEQYTLTRQAFSDDGDQAINHRQVEDAIVAGTADLLFDQVADLHFETFDDGYSQKDWYGQLCRLLDSISP